MKTERKALHGVPQRRNQENLAEQAIQLDRQIKAAVIVARRSVTDLGGLLAQMRESRLWEHLPHHYRGWEDYARSVLGSGGHSILHETLAAFSLTKGAHAIPSEDVNTMGVKRGAQLARLAPEQRTPEIREMAKTEPVMVVRNKVQAVLNQELPADEQKPMLKLLAINLPEELVQEFEELMEVMGHTDGARDGDNSQTIRAKAFKLILIGAQQHWAQELGEALVRMKAEAGVDDSPAAAAQADFPEEEEGLDFSDEAHL